MIAVVAGVVVREGRVLVCQRRAGGRLALKWEFPGGKLEAGESPEEALVRELREELCAEVSVGDILDAKRTLSDGRDLLILFYFAHLVSGEPAPVECEQLRWAKPEELDSFDWAPTDRMVADRLPDLLRRHFSAESV